MKAWCCVCLLIFLYTIHILTDESYEVVYISDLEHGSEPVSYLACFTLETFYPNRSQFDLKQLRTDLHDHFDKFQNMWKSGEMKTYEKLILKRIASMEYIVWADMMCIRLGGKQEVPYLYRYFQGEMLKFVYDKRTFDPVELKDSHFVVNQMVMINLEHRYSNCLGAGYSRNHCLNECFKRLSRYIYEGHETGPVLRGQPNEATLREEHECFGQCKKEDCKLTFYFVSSSLSTGEAKPKIFKGVWVLTAFEFWFKLVGLMCLFFGISLYQSLSALIELAMARNWRSRSRAERCFLGKPTKFWLKSVVLLASLLVFAYLNAKMIEDFEERTKQPVKKEITVNLMEPEGLDVVVCFLMYQNADYFQRSTLLKIEQDTNDLIEKIDGVFLEFQNKEIEADYTVLPLVLFRGLSRCFQLAVRPKEPRYRSLLAISKLVIKIKKFARASFYLLAEGEQFNTNSYFHTGYFSVVKKILRKASDCVDYQQIHPNCSSRSR